MSKRLNFLLLSLAIVSNLATSQEMPEHTSLVGSWEGPLVIGRDSTNLAFTFSIQEGEYAAEPVAKVEPIKKGRKKKKLPAVFQEKQPA